MGIFWVLLSYQSCTGPTRHYRDQEEMLMMDDRAKSHDRQEQEREPQSTGRCLSPPSLPPCGISLCPGQCRGCPGTVGSAVSRA